MLSHVLDADSVAIVGASRNETKRGFQAIRTLTEEKYEGRIYPINPKETSVLGFKCYKKITDIKGTVDLALITTPAFTLPAILEIVRLRVYMERLLLPAGLGKQAQREKSLKMKSSVLPKKKISVSSAPTLPE